MNFHATSMYLSWKRKDDSEGKNKREAKNHEELFSGFESLSRNCKPMLVWISVLAYISDSSIFSTSISNTFFLSIPPLNIGHGKEAITCLFSWQVFMSRGTVLKDSYLRNYTWEASFIPQCHLYDNILHFNLYCIGFFWGVVYSTCGTDINKLWPEYKMRWF